MSAIPTSPVDAPPAAKRRAVDVAYDAIESMISTLQLEPGRPVVDAVPPVHRA